MHARPEADEWLMAQVACGRREYLEPLVRRHATPLLSFLARLAGDRHRGEELFQEVFLAVWVKRGRYAFPRPFKPWLYAIAVNKCRELFRRGGPAPVPLDPAAEAPADEPTPPESLVAAEAAGQVDAAVARLPAQQRAVVHLRVWEGLSYGEIAAITGRTEATVRSHMHHALAGIRTRLTPIHEREG
ncbi:MAG: RNA polymerase sigma factor [Catenulispora sp.]